MTEFLVTPVVDAASAGVSLEGEGQVVDVLMAGAAPAGATPAIAETRCLAMLVVHTDARTKYRRYN